MEIGDKIQARFLTIPENFPGSGQPFEVMFPIRSATVVYVHPKGRYIVAATEVDGKEVRETFRPEEVLTQNPKKHR